MPGSVHYMLTMCIVRHFFIWSSHHQTHLGRAIEESGNQETNNTFVQLLIRTQC
jgi:hypothetical protein